MAHLDDLVTSSLSGEIIQTDNMGYSSGFTGYFKQDFTVTPNYSNFTWTVKSKLYLKVEITVANVTAAGHGIYMSIGGNIKSIGDTASFSQNSNPYSSYVAIAEHTTVWESNNGRQALKIKSGKNNSTFDNYRYIYATLPSFSGMRFKNNENWIACMPWIKVNGAWKKALQYKKVNGEWKEEHDTWFWDGS